MPRASRSSSSFVVSRLLFSSCVTCSMMSWPAARLSCSCTISFSRFSSSSRFLVSSCSVRSSVVSSSDMRASRSCVSSRSIDSSFSAACSRSWSSFSSPVSSSWTVLIETAVSSGCPLSSVLRREVGGEERLRLCRVRFGAVPAFAEAVLTLSLVRATAHCGIAGGNGDTGEPQSPPTLSRRPPSEAVRYSSESEENSSDLGVSGVTGDCTTDFG
uniref:Putative secreted protein n=1 Tax=Anopheles triannulatus TaxID=58253 RepID=A0A2M4AVD3_9DIPT